MTVTATPNTVSVASRIPTAATIRGTSKSANGSIGKYGLIPIPQVDGKAA